MSHFWPPRIPECKLTVLKNSKQSSLKSNPLLTQGNLLKWVSPREHFLDPFPPTPQGGLISEHSTVARTG